MNWDWNKIYDNVFNWIITYGPKVLAAIVVLLIGLWLIRVLNRIVKKSMERRNFNPSLRYFLQNLVAIVLQILLVLLVLQIAGLQLTFLTAIIAGLTVAAGLALSGTLQNFVSGILILILKPFRVGDNISTQGHEGTVSSIQIFFTTVTTYDNKTISIPNGQLSNHVVVNLTREGKRRLDIEMKFSYGIDYEAVKSVLLQTLSKVKGVKDDPGTRIGISALEPDKYTVVINAWTDAHGFIDTKMEVQENMMKDLKSAGIKLPGT